MKGQQQELTGVLVYYSINIERPTPCYFLRNDITFLTPRQYFVAKTTLLSLWISKYVVTVRQWCNASSSCYKIKPTRFRISVKHRMCSYTKKLGYETNVLHTICSSFNVIKRGEYLNFLLVIS